MLIDDDNADNPGWQSVAKLSIGDTGSFVKNVYAGSLYLSSINALQIETTASNRNISIMTNGTGKVGIGTTSPGSKLEINGSVGVKVVGPKTSAYTAADETVILADATSASFTITLPAAVGCPGRIYYIKKVNSGNTVTIGRTGSNTIDGATSQSLSTQWSFYQLVSDGSSQWYIIGS
jgi:hypothetical protein